MNIQTLPKVELHCHLDGILSPTLVRQIQQSQPDFPINLDVFEQAYPIQGLVSFFEWWAHIHPLNGNLDYYKPIIQQYIEGLKAQNVRYFELMIPNGEIPDDLGAAVAKVSDYREWVNRCEGDAIQVEFIYVFSRTLPAEYHPTLEAKVLALWEAGLIIGVAFAGPEINFPVKPFSRSFARFHEAGLGIEIHAGEWVGAESVWDALEHGYPDRIGHGVNLFDDPRLIEIFQERQIHVEMCPTSNLQTGSVARIEDHPIRRAYDLGLNIGINTDDPGCFLCTMNSEYELISEVFGFDEATWLKIYQNSLDARFQKTLRIPNL